SEDVRLRAVDVVQQGNAGRAVRIVLDRIYPGRNAIFAAAKVDDTILLLVTTTAVPDRDKALIITSTLLLFGTQQALLRLSALRQFGEVANAGVAAASGRRTVLSNAHGLVS